MDSGLVLRVHVGVVRVRHDAALLEGGGHGLCILLREDVHNPYSTGGTLFRSDKCFFFLSVNKVCVTLRERDHTPKQKLQMNQTHK